MLALRKSTLVSPVAAILVVLVAFLALPSEVNAGLVTTKEGAERTERAQDIETVRKALETKMVRRRLRDLGYTEQEITLRLSLLTDQELHTLASRIESLNAGGTAPVVGFGIFILVLAALVVWLTIHQLLHPEKSKTDKKDEAFEKAPDKRSAHRGSSFA